MSYRVGPQGGYQPGSSTQQPLSFVRKSKTVQRVRTTNLTVSAQPSEQVIPESTYAKSLRSMKINQYNAEASQILNHVCKTIDKIPGFEWWPLAPFFLHAGVSPKDFLEITARSGTARQTFDALLQTMRPPQPDEEEDDLDGDNTIESRKQLLAAAIFITNLSPGGALAMNDAGGFYYHMRGEISTISSRKLPAIVPRKTITDEQVARTCATLVQGQFFDRKELLSAHFNTSLPQLLRCLNTDAGHPVDPEAMDEFISENLSYKDTQAPRLQDLRHSVNNDPQLLHMLLKNCFAERVGHNGPDHTEDESAFLQIFYQRIREIWQQNQRDGDVQNLIAELLLATLSENPLCSPTAAVPMDTDCAPRVPAHQQQPSPPTWVLEQKPSMRELLTFTHGNTIIRPMKMMRAYAQAIALALNLGSGEIDFALKQDYPIRYVMAEWDKGAYYRQAPEMTWGNLMEVLKNADCEDIARKIEEGLVLKYAA